MADSKAVTQRCFMVTVPDNRRLLPSEVIALGVVSLSRLPGNDYFMIRASVNPGAIAAGDVCIGIGGCYSPEKGDFDLRAYRGTMRRLEYGNEIPYSIASLVWQYYAQQVIRNIFSEKDTPHEEVLLETEVFDLCKAIDKRLFEPIDIVEHRINQEFGETKTDEIIAYEDVLHHTGPLWANIFYNANLTAIERSKGKTLEYTLPRSVSDAAGIIRRDIISQRAWLKQKGVMRDCIMSRDDAHPYLIMRTSELDVSPMLYTNDPQLLIATEIKGVITVNKNTYHFNLVEDPPYSRQYRCPMPQEWLDEVKQPNHKSPSEIMGVQSAVYIRPDGGAFGVRVKEDGYKVFEKMLAANGDRKMDTSKPETEVIGAVSDATYESTVV